MGRFFGAVFGGKSKRWETPYVSATFLSVLFFLCEKPEHFWTMVWGPILVGMVRKYRILVSNPHKMLHPPLSWTELTKMCVVAHRCRTPCAPAFPLPADSRTPPPLSSNTRYLLGKGRTTWGATEIAKPDEAAVSEYERYKAACGATVDGGPEAGIDEDATLAAEAAQAAADEAAEKQKGAKKMASMNPVAQFNLIAPLLKPLQGYLYETAFFVCVLLLLLLLLLRPVATTRLTPPPTPP